MWTIYKLWKTNEHTILKLWTLIKNIFERTHKFPYNILFTFLMDRGRAPNGIGHLMILLYYYYYQIWIHIMKQTQLQNKYWKSKYWNISMQWKPLPVWLYNMKFCIKWWTPQLTNITSGPDVCDQLFELNKYTFYLMIYCTLGQFWLVSNMGLPKEGIMGDWLAHIFMPYKKIKAMFCWR